MNDELDALLRDHYRAAADGVHTDAETVRRFQEAGRTATPVRSVLRRWMLPALAAAVTAAVLVAMAVLVWPGAREKDPPPPLAPPASPAPARTPSPAPTDLLTAVPGPQGPEGGTVSPGGPLPQTPTATPRASR